MTTTQRLVMEVLAARYRLGEQIWTFVRDSATTKALAGLSKQGLAFTTHGIVEGTVRAGLTTEGKAMFLGPDVICPQCGGDASDNWFDRSLCSEGEMHTRCTVCGFALDGCGDDSPASSPPFVSEDASAYDKTMDAIDAMNRRAAQNQDFEREG